MQELINRLEALSEAWKGQFDNPPSTPLVWEIDASTGVLRLNGKDVCLASTISPSGETYDAEYLFLETTFGEVSIFIEWPFAGDAEVKEVETYNEDEDYLLTLRKFEQELAANDGRYDVLYAKYSNKLKQAVSEGRMPGEPEASEAALMVDVIERNIVDLFMARRGWALDLSAEPSRWFQPSKEDLQNGNVFSGHKVYIGGNAE